MVLGQLIPAVISLGQHHISESQETQRHHQEHRPTTHNQTTSNVYAIINVDKSTPQHITVKKEETSLGGHFVNGMAVGAGVMAGAALVGGVIAGARWLMGTGGKGEVKEAEREKEKPMLENRFRGEEVLFSVEVEEM
ncbi:hypothetical protein ABW19_dt0208131 [Dactylella cylindrospora]|nr:hypothetical protein ABW19_dt0208131 [Dactylella cylindrospora]